MLTCGDDFPFHQTAEPAAFPATSDPNFYDRYFFNGYASDFSFFFALALGIYPNRRIMDAAFSAVMEDRQSIVRSSRVLHDGERLPLRVGPIQIDIVEPLRILAVHVDPNPYGLQAHLRFERRALPIQEPRFQRRTGPRLWMDYTRLTQHGHWSGALSIEGQNIPIDPGHCLGSRDRSWGVRPVGEPEEGLAFAQPQFFWLWAPLHLPSRCLHFSVSEESDGHRWHELGTVLPTLDSASPQSEPMPAKVAYALRFVPGTRWISWARLSFTHPDSETQSIVELEPQKRFLMAGLGYGHPQWGHGRYQGVDVTDGELWDIGAADPTAPMYLHVQNLCRVCCGNETGVGVLEQLILGPHQPTGFRQLLDVAP